MPAQGRPLRPGDSAPQAHAGPAVFGEQPVRQVVEDAGARPVVVNVEQRRMGRGLTAFIVVAVSVALLCFAGCSMAATAAFSGLALTPATSSAVAGGPQVAVFHMDAAISSTTGITPELVRSVVSRVENDPDIVALVVRTDCTGGGAAASEEVAAYIAGCSKPVVFSVGSFCASGAYMAASQSDWITAGPMSEVGSIGVIMTMYDLQGLYEKLGLDVEVVKSVDSKDLGAAYRPLTDEERAELQAKVDAINEMFIAMVAEGRGEPQATVEQWATGTTYLGGEALEMGLIDELGTYDDALAKAAELGGVSRGGYRVVSVDPVPASSLDTILSVLGF